MNLTDLELVLEAYKAAVYAKDVDAFMGLYSEDVSVFDMWGKWSYTGAPAWREMVTDWFGSLGTERVVVDFDEVQSMMTEELGSLHAFVTYQGDVGRGRGPAGDAEPADLRVQAKGRGLEDRPRTYLRAG